MLLYLLPADTRAFNDEQNHSGPYLFNKNHAAGLGPRTSQCQEILLREGTITFLEVIHLLLQESVYNGRLRFCYLRYG